MEVLREFLATSTIHGLAHIATSTSTLGKVAWSAIVTLGFSLAVCLIAQSYSRSGERASKLDGVGPVDNRPLTNDLHHLVLNRKYIKTRALREMHPKWGLKTY